MIRNSSSPHIDFLSQNDIHSYNLEILNRSWTGQCWDICRRVWLLLYDFWFKEALQDVVMSPPRLSWLPTAYIVLAACLQHNREARHSTFKTFISIITDAENNNNNNKSLSQLWIEFSLLIFFKCGLRRFYTNKSRVIYQMFVRHYVKLKHENVSNTKA